METKSSKWAMINCIIFCVLYSNISFSQTESFSYDSVYVNDIEINFKKNIFSIVPTEIPATYGANFVFEEKFVKETFPGELEGVYPLVYYNYKNDGFNINFYSYEKNGLIKYLNYFLFTNNSFKLSVKGVLIRAGDSINTLQPIFQNSYIKLMKELENKERNLFLKVKVIDNHFLILIEIDGQFKKIKSIKIQSIANMA